MKAPDYSFQKQLIDNCIKELYTASSGSVVLAAAPGAGKTNMAIEIIGKYLEKYPNSNVLIFTHGLSYLRFQFQERIRLLRMKGVIASSITSKQIQSSTEAFDKKVIVAIPQTFRVKYPKNHNIGLMIVDEAHNFYHAEMIQKHIKYFKPRHQLLLTGTPSIFVKKNEPRIIAVSTQELMSYHVVSDPIISLVHSKYEWDLNSYNNNRELREEIELKKEQTFSTLDSVMKHLYLKRFSKQDYSNINEIAEEVGKTFIACRDQSQAKQVLKYFKTHKVKCAISISDLDPLNNSINEFINNPECLILIVVHRGILGFNFEKLLNVVDISGSHNPDRIYQLLSRAVRLDPDNQVKIFLKITPGKLAYYTYAVMSLVVSLSDKNKLLSYDGIEDKFKIKIPLQIENYIQSHHKNNTAEKNFSLAVDSLPELKLSIGEDFYEYVTTTLFEVRSRMNSRFPSTYWTEEKCTKSALKYNIRKEWYRNDRAAYDASIEKGWYEQCTAHMKLVNQTHTKQVVHTSALKYNKRYDWKKNDPGKYNYARRRGWLEELTKHMIPSLHGRKYSMEELIESSKNYVSPRMWKKDKESMYSFALKNDLMDKLIFRVSKRNLEK